jgi:hypothetical protein
VITGTEYTFGNTTAASPPRRVVYNFLFAPGQGIVRTSRASIRRPKTTSGISAAQFQFVMDDALSREARDGILQR